MAVQLFVEHFVVVVGNIQSLGQESRYNSEVKDTKSISNTALFAEKKKTKTKKPVSDCLH